MFDNTRIADDFSFAANRYAKRARLQAKIGETLIARTMPHMPSDALLLDVGAGSGELTKRWPVGRAVALDLAVGMCEEVTGQHIPAINANAEQLPIRHHALDALSSNLMLQWISDPKQFLSESCRVLKTGGIFAITHFAEGTLIELEHAFSAAGQGARVSPFHAADRMLQRVKDAGFEIICEATETRQEKYHGVMDLCGFIRDIGATNKRIDRPRGLLTPRALRSVTASYPREGLGIMASWVVQYVVARKAK